MGGIPAGVKFFLSYNELKPIVNDINWEKWFKGTKSEICFIGLLAYFESFFKDQFAAIINICPWLIHKLKNSNFDVTVDICDLINYGITVPNKFGFILADKYDFGSAQRINSLFSSLIEITPFSKDEKKEYDLILQERNLIVHHGGIITVKYSNQHITNELYQNRVFSDSIVLSEEKMLYYMEFCEKIVRKLMKASRLKIIEENKGQSQSKLRKYLIDALDSDI
jgi:hypothetical protein